MIIAMVVGLSFLQFLGFIGTAPVIGVCIDLAMIVAVIASCCSDSHPACMRCSS
jgi:hypothetical protein